MTFIIEPTRSKSQLAKDLLSLWPGLPYLSFGVLSTWALLAYSGSFWLSNTEVDGRYISHLYLICTGIYAAIFLGTAFLSKKRHILNFGKTANYLFAGACSLGALLVILAGPYYMGIPWFFYSGSVLCGIGIAFLTLRCAWLYGMLEPGKIVVYVVLSQLLIAALYFLFLGTEFYRPVAGGPSLSGIIGLVLLPIMGAFLLILPMAAPGKAKDGGKVQPTDLPAETNQELVPSTKDDLSSQTQAKAKPQLSLSLVPVSFWKLCFAVFAIAVVTSVIKGLNTHIDLPTTTVIYSNILMLLRIAFSVAFLYFTFRTVKRFNFGKLYLILMVGIAIALTLASSMELYGGMFTLLLGFSLDIFDILLWCMLALIVHQTKISYLVVFGFGRGVFMLGAVIGWTCGAWLLPLIESAFWTSLIMVFLATIILISAVLVFSEKDFDRLFSTILTSEINLADLEMGSNHASQAATGKTGAQGGQNTHQRPFTLACKQVAKAAHLTERESDIFELLALGRGSESIAERMHISMNTVRTHTQNIYYKLDVHSRSELVKLVEAAKSSLKNL